MEPQCMPYLLTMLGITKSATNIQPINTYRNGATSAQHIVLTADNAGVGTYTCSITISTVASADSNGYTVTARGLLFDMV